MRILRSEWQTIHSTLSAIINLLWSIGSNELPSKHCFLNSTQITSKSYLQLGPNVDYSGTIQESYRNAIQLVDRRHYWYLLIFHWNSIPNEPSGPSLESYTQKLWQRYVTVVDQRVTNNNVTQGTAMPIAIIKYLYFNRCIKYH